MLPVTAMCLLAGSVVVTRRTAAAQATAVDQGVGALNELVTLRDSMLVQQTASAFDVRFLELGVNRAIASEFLGFDWSAPIVAQRESALAAIAALGADSPIAEDVLQALYAGIDSGVIDPRVATERFGGYVIAIGDRVTSGLDRLEVNASQTPLVIELESLREVIRLVDLATPQAIDLSQAWFPSPGDTPQTTAAAMAQLSARRADFTASIERLRELGVPSVIGHVERMEADPKVQLFDLSATDTLRGEPLFAPGDVLDESSTAAVAATFEGYFVRNEILEALVTTAAQAVRVEATLLAGTERGGFLLWTFGAGALALASIGVALWLARSISKPLKDLARYAHAVNEGELDATASPSRHQGPRETRMAFGVFTEMVANLQLLDAKANALAHCDFDDPVLRVPLPGRLGRSLESSVALLSGSIVERDQLQTHLAHEATHDSLTGINNRAAAITVIEAAMHRAARTAATIGVLFVDLNDFKAVNDSHGHEVGDEVLRQVAARLLADLRSGDFVARLGGDEFIVVAEGIADVADATYLARRIIDTISEPIEVGKLNISIGAAVGVALTLDGPEEPLRLLARADAAMYRAKYHKQSAIEIFDADLQQQMLERVDIETALTAALHDPIGGGLQLHYQPVLDATSSALVGVEALIRWDRPGDGMLQPDSFIPIAEATSLIIDLDCWVLRETTRQLVSWSTVEALADVPVAVNISGRHLLSRQLPDHIRAVLAETGVDPRRLSIEITETVLLEDLAAAAAELDIVRALGVSVAIDDFGTGYTSLAHLQQLPIDTIKIDRSFISQLNVRRGSSLVRMVTDLGHAIDINIVAEGVETDEEMRALQTMGADHLQGFLLSRPLTADALSTWAQGHAAVASSAPVRTGLTLLK
jgi:diguanylate cyclase (GGDEF)-like protein